MTNDEPSAGNQADADETITFLESADRQIAFRRPVYGLIGGLLNRIGEQLIVASNAKFAKTGRDAYTARRIGWFLLDLGAGYDERSGVLISYDRGQTWQSGWG